MLTVLHAYICMYNHLLGSQKSGLNGQRLVCMMKSGLVCMVGFYALCCRLISIKCGLMALGSLITSTGLLRRSHLSPNICQMNAHRYTYY